MRIAINTLSVRGGGGLTFLRNLLRYLPVVGVRDEFLILVTPQKIDALGLADSVNPNVKLLVLPERNWVARVLWEQTMLPAVLRRHGVDVLYAPGNQGPVLFPCPFVVVVQNIDPLVCDAQGMSLAFRAKLRALRLLTRLSVWKARGIIAVSERTRELLCDEFGCNRESISVVPHGRPEDADSPLLPSAVERTARLISRLPFLLAVSSVKHNKNYETLIKAFGTACRNGMRSDLVIAGEIEHRECYTQLRALVREFAIEDRVHFAGAIDSETLRCVYDQAQALVFPSRIESFGLPPLEAMTYGVPVVAARVEPVIEICGDAILYFDPADFEELSVIMQRIVNEATLRSDLIRRGKERSARFTWTSAAQDTFRVLRSAAPA